MTRGPHAPLGVALIAALAACGDNAIPCGEGTTEQDGSCTAPPPIACDTGTKLDNGRCVLDPVLCGDGTVLIAARCVDPSRGLVVDLEEGPEPNGLGVAGIEPAPASAGDVELASDAAFVLHGELAPFADRDGDGQLDPDFDTYELTASSPSVIELSVDGIGGMIGAFYLTAELVASGATHYERYALPLTGDTARRRVYIPAAGVYRLVIGDARSIAIGNQPPAAAGRGGATGEPAEYYVSLARKNLDAPVLAAATQSGSLAPGDVIAFTASLPGARKITDRMTGAAVAALAVRTDSGLAYDEETPTSDADVSVLGGNALIVLDTVHHVGPAAEPYALSLATP